MKIMSTDNLVPKLSSSSKTNDGGGDVVRVEGVGVDLLTLGAGVVNVGGDW